MCSGDEVVVVVEAGRIRAVHMTRSAAGVLHPSGAVARRPLSVVADGLGAPATAGTADTAGPHVDGLLPRVGDPVPVRVGSLSWPGEVLVARVIADAAAAVGTPSAAHLVVVVPDEWHDHRGDLLRRAVVELTGRSVTTVAAARGLVGPGPEDETVPTLVLETGDECFRAAVLDHEGGGWRVRRTGRSDWGGTDIDDALLDFVGDRSPSVVAEGGHDATALRAACTRARDDLTRLTATEVELPGTDPVRLVRADLELLVGRTVAEVVDRLLADVGDPERGLPARVLVTGSLASLPMVVEAVSAAVGAAVEHVTEEHALQRYAVAGAADLASASVTPTPTAPDGTGSEAIGAARHRPAHRGAHRVQRGRHRRTAVLVAASLTVTAPVAAMTLTDTGESTLLAFVDGIVPEAGPADDPGPGDVRSALTDAVTLPPTPWGGTEASDGSTTDADGAGGDAAPDGDTAATEADTDPTPTSTRGGRSGAGTDARRADEGGTETGRRGSPTDGRAAHTEKGSAVGTAEGRATDRTEGSASTRRPTPTSSHVPSTPDSPSTDSTDDTTAPATSEPDPTSTSPDPSTTTPEPSTTTPEPSTTTAPSTTTEPSSTTTPPELGTP